MSAKSGKRAAVACDYCRRRKRKCNGGRPTCTLCLETDRECHYQETEQERHDAETARFEDILQRLDRLEESIIAPSTQLRQEQQQQGDIWPGAYNDSINCVAESSPSYVSTAHGPQGRQPRQLPAVGLPMGAAEPSPSGNLSDVPVDAPVSGHLQVMQELNYHEDRSGLSQGVMIIPMWHSTTTGGLLQVPSVRDLLGRYPADLFLRNESRRPPVWSKCQAASTPFAEVDIDALIPLVVDDRGHEDLLDAFVSNVNSQYCVFDNNAIRELRDLVGSLEASGTFPLPLMRARLYTTLALGSVSRTQRDLVTVETIDSARLVESCAQVALQEWMQYSGDDLLLPQTLYLLALYYGYLCRPLVAAKFLHMASTAVQQFMIRQHTVGRRVKPNEHEAMLRLLWAIFLHECDLLAEYHLPRSGVEHVVEKLPYPDCGNPPEKNMMAWLANLSARRLLNRVHYVVYDTAVAQQSGLGASPSAVDSTLGTMARDLAASVPQLPLTGVTEELSRQLQAWYSVLPVGIRPRLDEPTPSVHEALLLLRYNASGHIIYRPYLFHVCALPEGAETPEDTVNNAVKCLHHCREFLRASPYRIGDSCGSLESTLHAVFACIIMLTLGAHNHLLSCEVRDIHSLQSKALSILSEWAFPGSCVEGMLHIATVLREKTHLLIENPL